MVLVLVWKVLILVLVILFEPKSNQYFSAILLQKFEHWSKEMQQDRPTAFALESHQDQTLVTAATAPAICPHNMEKKHYRLQRSLNKL